MSYIDISQPIEGAPNFSWAELCATNHRDFIELNRQVPLAFQGAGIALAKMLQQVRDNFARPLIVHSGYRRDELNTIIGGSKTSQHRKFEAADFHIIGVPLAKVFAWVTDESGLSYGQAILEGWDPDNGDASWLHLSLGHPFRAAEKSGQVWTMSTKRRKAGEKAYRQIR